MLAIMLPLYAGMAELVDALDSKSSEGNFMGVRFPLPAPNHSSVFLAILPNFSYIL